MRRSNDWQSDGKRLPNLYAVSVLAHPEYARGHTAADNLTHKQRLVPALVWQAAGHSIHLRDRIYPGCEVFENSASA